jgi:hypothetical protein
VVCFTLQGNKKIPFIKITLAIPKLIAPAKRLLEKREVNFRDFSNISYAAFESNIDFEIRFMADTKVVGCNWIELPANKHQFHKDTGMKILVYFVPRSFFQIAISTSIFFSEGKEACETRA